ncbi:MAG: hydrogenase expression/formation protein HypE [Cyclobacteriaceae bacterium]|nr:hydrogenase expression/formation protein HypE [Cyclobacteriaceae bacterium]
MSNLTNLQCPLPQLDFDIITLGHGGGGLLTNRLLDKAIFELFDNEKLQTRHDGAVLSFGQKVAFSTDSFVISPVFFPGGNIGELAVNGTVNDVAMCGASPRYISLALIIEEGLPVTELWDILVHVKAAAEKAGVWIVTGDTKVVERGKGDKIFINTTGVGEMHPNADISTNNVKQGDKIIVSGNVATHGMAIMSVRKGLEFETSIESDTCNLNHTIGHLLDEFGSQIHLMRDPTRGGVASTLNEIARDTQLGIDIVQDAIPIDTRVDSACEILGLDPLYVANEGVFISFVDSSVADAYLKKLQSLEFGENSAIIGEVVADHPNKVVLTSKIGGKRVVNMQVGEQLPRIC